DDDGDGLDDRLEAALDGDLLGDGDADDDGVLDGDEPDFAIDVDSDGAIDALDPDSDDDGLFDGTELGRTATTTDTDLSRGRFRPDNDPETTFPLVEDSDLGGVADGMEDMNGNGRIDDGETNPNDPTDDERSDSSRDADGDGLPDDVDNCPSDPNPDQADLDQDGRGDACDSDADGDGFDDDLSLRGSGCRSGGTPSGWGLWWAGLLVFVAARRRRILLAALFLVVGPAPAAAQTETTNFSLERFRLAADGQGFLDVEGAEVLPHLEVSASAWLGYEQNPLVLARDGEPVGALVEQRVAGEVSAALGLFGFASVGVVVPFAAIQERETVQVGVNGPLGALGGGLADIRIVPKLRVLTESDAGIGLSFLPALTVPGSGDSSYLGEGNLTFTPELALGRSLGPVRLGLNLGYRFRPRRRFLGVVVDDEITARLSVGTRLAPLDVGITGALAARADAPFESEGETAAEILAGVRGPLLSSLYLFGAGGVGLLDGYGTPELRALLGLRWLSPREESVPPLEGPAALDFSADPDGDEVIALDDLCPDEPGLVILDGCPNHDRDADGLLVVNDECPEVAEDMDGFEDTDGCPDLDDDRDLTPDVEDACPRVAGPRSHRGCPVRDSDGDGVPDAIDNCPGTSGLAGRS
ncbi:MAG: thrombospondin type 3 repeat-containing protein, partial [Myxococcota bacterium]